MGPEHDPQKNFPNGQILVSGLTPSQLMEMLGDVVSQRVDEALKKAKCEDLQEKFLSVEEVRNLFVPALSRQTIHNWTKDGTLKKHSVSGRVYYRYSEILEAVKHLRKYQRRIHLPKTKSPAP